MGTPMQIVFTRQASFILLTRESIELEDGSTILSHLRCIFVARVL